jgi:antitoxin HicB
VRRYTVVLTPEVEDGGYSVSVPALPGCYSQGESVEEALDHIREAIGLHLWSLQQEGEPIPDDVSPVIRAVDAEPQEGHPPTNELLAATDPSVKTTRSGS